MFGAAGSNEWPVLFRVQEITGEQVLAGMGKRGFGFRRPYQGIAVPEYLQDSLSLQKNRGFVKRCFLFALNRQQGLASDCGPLDARATLGNYKEK